MSMYAELLEEFKSELRVVLEQYVASKKSKGLSEHRLKDVRAFEWILAKSKTHSELKEGFEQQYSRMLTGAVVSDSTAHGYCCSSAFSLFPGRSALRTKLKVVLGKDKFSDSNFEQQMRLDKQVDEIRTTDSNQIQELREENEALKALLRLHLTQGEKKKDAMSEFEEFKPLREIQKERCGLANFDIDDESSLASSSDEEQDCLHPM